MILIGEKLNSSVPSALEAMNDAGDENLIKIVKRQARGGANYIDVNTALTGERETENMKRVISIVLENCKKGIVLDSPDPNVITGCIGEAAGRPVIINSVSGDPRFDGVIEAAREYGAGLICLPMRGKQIPAEAGERARNAGELIEKLRGQGIADKQIYIDLLTESAATNGEAVKAASQTLRLIKREYPSVRTVCGLSNVSFGLPRRAALNAAFLTILLRDRLDAAILDVNSEPVMTALRASEALLGRDEYCMKYISYIRSLD